MTEEFIDYADSILESLAENQFVKLEVSDDGRCLGVTVTNQEGKNILDFIIYEFEDVMDILIYMIRIGGNYNYRMEGKAEDVNTGSVFIHIKNVPN